MAKCGKCQQSGVTVDHVRKCFAQPTFAPTQAAVVAKPVPVPPMYDWSAVPAGRYAVVEEGVVKFYMVDQPKKGKWAGFTFLKLLVGSPGDYAKYPVKNKQTRIAVLGEIAKNPQEAMERYGHESGTCGKCGAALSDPKSLERGIGPVCADTLGWDAVA